ncbi:hypothetical protein [Streptomyces sp. NPDC001970]
MSMPRREACSTTAQLTAAETKVGQETKALFGKGRKYQDQWTAR